MMVWDVLLGMKLLWLDLDWFKKYYGFNLKIFCVFVLIDLELDGFIFVFDSVIELIFKGIFYGDFVGVILLDYFKKSYVWVFFVFKFKNF